MKRPVGEQAWRRLFRVEALTKQNGKCLYCLVPLSARDATADHKQPSSKRGLTTRENIGAACEQCNRAKGDMPHVEFFKIIDRKTVPRNVPVPIMLVWFTRHVMTKAQHSSNRIMRCAR
jgi:5-methylcytosine-specific restriction endonuclease McrA